MEKYILNSIEIEKFRNISKSTLKFGNKINIISGQNGVGKSTILALICSAVGLHRKISGIDYSPKFHKYLYISPSEAEKKEYKVLANFKCIDSEMTIKKRLRLKWNENKRVQIIPELEISDVDLNKSKYKTKKEYKDHIKNELGIGISAKLNMPAMYCSTSRIYPLSEIDKVGKPTNETEISQMNGQNEFYSVASFYKEKYNAVLRDTLSDESKFYRYSKASIANNELSMEINGIEPLSKSVGQNALGVIVACLTKFKFLQEKHREEYKGGILCIDEADITLHPEAQLALLEMLCDVSEELNLQIFLTTHSFTLIEKLNQKINRNINDFSINYFYDSYNPRLKINPSIDEIESDLMSIEKNTEVKIYFEDDRSLAVHEFLMEAAKNIEGIDVNPNKIKYKYIVAKAGKDVLKNLVKQDDYFETPLIILDGDAKLSEKTQKMLDISVYLDNEDKNNAKSVSDVHLAHNCMTLPSYLAPEGYLFNILYKYTRKNDSKAKEFWEYIESQKKVTPGVTAAHIDKEWLVSKNDIDKQVKRKNDFLKDHIKWSKVLDFFKENDVLTYYYKQTEHCTELKSYIDKFNKLLEKQNKINSNKKRIIK